MPESQKGCKLTKLLRGTHQCKNIFTRGFGTQSAAWADHQTTLSAEQIQQFLEKHPGVHIIEIVSVGDELNQLQGHNDCQNRSGEGEDHIIGKILNHVEDASLHSRLNRTRKALAFRWMCCPLSIDICPQYAIIQPNKMQTPIKPQLDKRLHFPFSEGSHAASTNRPPTHNCTLKFNIKPEGTTSLSRRKKLINNSGIPQHEIEHIARCILPDILAHYESEEGQREFREWQAQHEAGQTERKGGEV